MKTKFLFLALFLSCFFGFSQNSRLNKANKEYSIYSYVEAQKNYLKFKELETNPEALLNLANTYYFNSDYKTALVWYKKYFSLVPLSVSDVNSVKFYRFLQCLRANNEKDQANLLVETFTGLKDSDLNTGDYFSGRFGVNKSNVNTDFDTFGISFSDKERKSVLFSSNRTVKKGTDKVHVWNNKPYLKLYSGKVDPNGDITNPTLLQGEITDFEFHQSNPCVTKDGKKLFFTRSIFKDVSFKTSFLKIFSADYINGKWANITELPNPVNLIGFSSAHPTISPDNKLYFVSNRDNKENSDIYYIQLNKHNVFTPKDKVVHLSNQVNTPGREDFPFVNDSGVLFFSSDGHPGFGGLDVFAAAFADNQFQVVNLGEPVNSNSDDFSFIMNAKSKFGFVSSNREVANFDLIYKVQEFEPVKFKINTNCSIAGVVRDSLTNKPISNVQFKLINPESKEILTEVISDQDGNYFTEFPPYSNFDVQIYATDYTKKNFLIEALEPGQKLIKDVYLFNERVIKIDDKIVQMETGQDLTKILNLNPIYFDYNGYQVNKSSKLELDKVIALMISRPSVSIEIKSHTDSRGKDDFNMKLSENRAKATLDYILTNSKGLIDPSRLTAKGYGESLLINKCGNHIECSEAEHQLNRRSEFIIHFN